MCHTLKPDQAGRTHLGFAEEVQNAFGFLVRELNYRCVAREPTFVRYESDQVFVNVYHGRASYELGVEIGRLDSPGEAQHGYTLAELMRLVDPESEAGYRYVTARTAGLVEQGVAHLSELFRRYAGAALQGEADTFAQLHEQRRRWNHEYANEVMLSQVRPQAEEAFRRKDYAEALKLFESIREGLTPSELKKLEYARKKQQQQLDQ